MSLPEKILDPQESVLDVLVGALQDDTFPLLIVTDRRVVIAKNKLIRRWTVIAESPAADVSDAERRHHMLTEEVIVSVRSGRPLKLRTNRVEEADRIVALLRRLIAEGRGTGPGDMSTR